MGRRNKIKPPECISLECWRIARDLKYKMPDQNMEPLKYAVLLDRMRRAKVDRPTLGKAVALKAMQAQSYPSLDSALTNGASHDASKWAQKFQAQALTRRQLAHFWFRETSTSSITGKIDKMMNRKLYGIKPTGVSADSYYNRDPESERSLFVSMAYSSNGNSRETKKYVYWRFKMARGILRRMRAFEIIYGDIPNVIDVISEQDLKWSKPFPSGTAVLVCAKGRGYQLKTQWRDLGEVLREHKRKRLKDSGGPF